MRLRTLYDYLFYKLYNFWEVASTPSFWSDAKAISTIIIFQEFIVVSLMIYYRLFFITNSHLGEGIGEYLITFLALFIPNIVSFYYKDRWRLVVKNFEKIPKGSDRFGGIIIGLLFILILINLFFALFLFYNN